MNHFSFKSWVTQKGLLYRGALLALGMMGTVAGLSLEVIDNPVTKYVVFIVGICLLVLYLLAAAIHSYDSDRETFQSRQKQTIEQIETLLLTVKLILDELFPHGSDEPKLRLSVWFVDDPAKPQQVTQITSLVGTMLGNSPAGRFHPVYCGIVGEVIRLKTPRHHIISEQTEPQDYYVERLGFTLDEVRELDLSARSMYAVPVFHEDSDVLAVVYCSSLLPNFFGRKGNNTRQKRIIQAVAPVFLSTIAPQQPG